MTNVDVEHKVGDVDDQRLGEELRPCQHYLEDSELERARQKVFSYAVETLNESLVNKELLQQFKKSSKIEFGSWFHFEKKDGGFRYFYAHENHTLLDRSKLVCSRDDLAKPKDSFNKTHVIKSRSRGKMNTEGRFYKLTNLTVFAALLKDVPMRCNDAVVPEPMFKKYTISRLIFGENTRQPYFVPLSSHRSPFAWKSKTGRRNFKIFQFVRKHFEQTQSQLFQRSSFERNSSC